jgi:arylsulfatase A-like enzyme
LWVAALLAAALVGCRDKSPGLDLLVPARLAAGQAAGHDKGWISGEIGKTVRIHDVVERTIPAPAPSRLEFPVHVPRGGHFTVSCGIPEARHGQPGVEFVVKVREGNKDRVLASQLLDPINRPTHQRWVPLDVDLSKLTGSQTLVLETRGFETGAEAFWGGPLLTAPTQKAPLVVVYLVDTLRADHTTPYGYVRDTTPELAKLAADAVVFDAGISAASWTKPAVGSLMTSQLPAQHGAVQLRDPLDPNQITLAEMLRMKGFVTGAAIANSVIYSAHTNFEKGFEFFAGLHGADDRVSKVVEAGPVVDMALGWLATRTGLPTFLYVHTMDPHVPYTPPAPFDRKYEPTPSPEHRAQDPRFDVKEPADRERLIAQYDGEIAYGDQELGRFLRELKTRGLYDDAMIVFLADHGEEFQDHGDWLHGRSVFDELVRVPMIVKFPKNRHAGTRIAQQVQTVDLLPTILQEMGFTPPAPPTIVGHPMQAVVKGGAPEPEAVSEISHRGYVAYGIRGGRDKYVQRFSPEEDELYFDLRKDPQEKNSILAEAKQRTGELRGKLEGVMAPSVYQNHLKLVGESTYVLELRSAGFFENADTADFGLADKAEVSANKHSLKITAKPKAGQPREITLAVRPMGAPIWISGTRDGKPLPPADVRIAREGAHPPTVPCKLPEAEPSEHDEVKAAADGGDHDGRKHRVDALNVLEPPTAAAEPGVHLWVTLRPGASTMGPMSPEQCEELKALGYVSSCGGH